MPLTRRDTTSAFLTARARVAEWKEDFIRRYMQQDADLQLILLFERIPPEVKAELQARNPEGYALFEKEVNEARERSIGNGTNRR